MYGTMNLKSKSGFTLVIRDDNSSWIIQKWIQRTIQIPFTLFINTEEDISFQRVATELVRVGSSVFVKSQSMNVQKKKIRKLAFVDTEVRGIQASHGN